MSVNYLFSSAPRPVQVSRPRYVASPQSSPMESKERDSSSAHSIGNLMFDKRIVRGNTYSSVPQSSQAVLQAALISAALQSAAANSASSAHSKGSTSSLKEQLYPSDHKTIKVSNATMQTDSLLEPFEDDEEVAIQTAEAETQTEPKLEAPPNVSATFVPQPSGVDESTQIYPNDLFNFDVSVESLINPLVGRILYSAYHEVQQEEDLHSMLVYRDKLKYKKMMVMNEVRRLEMEDRRRETEREERRRVEKERAAKDAVERKEREEMKMEADRAIAEEEKERAYKASHEYVVATIQSDINQSFLPSLLQSVHLDVMGHQQLEKDSVDIITKMREDVENGLHTRERLRLEEEQRVKAEREANEKLRAEEEERRVSEMKKKEEEEAKKNLEKESEDGKNTNDEEEEDEEDDK